MFSQELISKHMHVNKLSVKVTLKDSRKQCWELLGGPCYAGQSDRKLRVHRMLGSRFRTVILGSEEELARD